MKKQEYQICEFIDKDPLVNEKYLFATFADIGSAVAVARKVADQSLHNDNPKYHILICRKIDETVFDYDGYPYGGDQQVIMAYHLGKLIEFKDQRALVEFNENVSMCECGS